MAAGALVVGGAGYGLGRAGDDAPLQAEVALDSSVSVAEEGAASPETMATWGGATTLPSPAGARMSFTGEGLSEESGAAVAWAFDGAGTVTAEAATRAAEVFGVSGEPRQEGGWVVGPSDGTEPTVHVMPDGTATVRFHDPARYRILEDVAPQPAPDSGAAEPAIVRPHVLSGEGSSGDAGPGGDADSPAASDDDGAPQADEPAIAPGGPGVVGPGPEPTAAEPEPADVPTDDGTADAPADDGAAELPAPGATAVPALPAPVEVPTAVAPDGQAPDGPAGVLYETLAALGLDPDAAEYATQGHWAGAELTTVVAHQLVDGTRTGQSWHADIGDGELFSFTGPLAPLVPLGEYDVVSPAQAVERLADPRFGATPVWTEGPAFMPVPEGTGRSWDDPPGPPPAAGEAIPWTVTDVTIVSAEPALTQQQTDDGASLLLPAYELSDSEGRTWSVLAVADHELAF